jgi:toxin FitB
MKYLLDTNVISEFGKIRSGRADSAVKQWSETVNTYDLFLSVITMQELKIGILQAARKDPQKATVLNHWLYDSVLTAFKGRILALDLAAGFISADHHVLDPSSYRDSFIAAIAIANQLTVVTRNTKDFERTGVPLLNPWLFGKPAAALA